jgi:two-component system, response regulator, stage 0 sporulation protein F
MMKVYASLLRDATTRRPRRPRVVVGDDDAELRAVLAMVLSDDGYAVAEAADGTSLVDLLLRDDAAEADAVVMDVRMPGYSGLEVLEKLRLAGRRVPVILVTACGREIEPRAQRLGARAIFRKPFDLDDLRTALAYIVEVGAPRAGGLCRAAPR